MKRIVLASTIVAASIIGLAACSTGPSSEVTSLPSDAPHPGAPVVTPAKAPAKADPYTTDGTWKVPSEIVPGSYRVELKPGKTSGYTEVCSDVACKIGKGMLSNDFLTASSTVDIPANAVMIKLRGVNLIPF